METVHFQDNLELYSSLPNKGVMYDERPKMKICPTFLIKEKDCFQLGISLHFRPFVVCYAFSKFTNNRNTFVPTYRYLDAAVYYSLDNI